MSSQLITEEIIEKGKLNETDDLIKTLKECKVKWNEFITEDELKKFVNLFSNNDEKIFIPIGGPNVEKQYQKSPIRGFYHAGQFKYVLNENGNGAVEQLIKSEKLSLNEIYSDDFIYRTIGVYYGESNDKKIYTINNNYCVKSIKDGGWFGVNLPSDYVIVDIDTAPDAKMFFELYKKNKWTCPIFKTNHGIHVLFKDTKGVCTNTSKVFTKCKIKTDYRTDKGIFALLCNWPGRGVITIPDKIQELPNELEPEIITVKKKLNANTLSENKEFAYMNMDLSKFDFKEEYYGDRGCRNTNLNKMLGYYISRYDRFRNEKALKELAYEWNNRFTYSPLPINEVDTCVYSAWNSYLSGKWQVVDNNIVDDELLENFLSQDFTNLF